jgi:hypothetical protein
VNARTLPPRGLRWADTAPARAAALFLAVVSLAVSVYVGYRYVRLVDCLRDGAIADQRRTSAIAGATDRERVAEAEYLRDPARGLQGLLYARGEVDRARAANPAPNPVPCN